MASALSSRHPRQASASNHSSSRARWSRPTHTPTSTLASPPSPDPIPGPVSGADVTNARWSNR